MHKRHSVRELWLGAAVLALVGAMIIPLPTWLLDGALALNVCFAFGLLVAAVYVRDALALATFPTLLLLSTMFRLALNVSSTRLALSDGHAGRVIEAFGEFVVRGDYVVGMVIFALLTLVQLLVVAKGSERVAEVTARFTLDAMPGKQMAIDADLRAGSIDQAEATRRRRHLERESQMFGAMDGAMKFVKGDVIAGLAIVLVNLFGGTAVGVFVGGLPLSDSLASYALIAVGDGLVSQLPSLCVATAAALLVTRVQVQEGAAGSLSDEIRTQLMSDPRPMWCMAGIALLLGLVPAMPLAPFALVAAAAAGAALYRTKKEVGAPSSADPLPTAGSPTPAPRQGMCRLMVDVAPNLAELVADGALLPAELEQARERLYATLGIRAPPIQIRANAPHLRPGEYTFLLDEVPCGRGVTIPGALYALAAPQDVRLLGVDAQEVQDPTTGRSVSHVAAAAAETLRMAQVPVQTASQRIAAHLTQVMMSMAEALVGVEETQLLVSELEPSCPTLVREAMAKVPIPLLADVARRLVREQVSIRNLRGVLEALVSPSAAGDGRALAERCRQSLSRELGRKWAPQGRLFAYLVDPSVEEALRSSVGDQPALSPTLAAQILEAVGRVSKGGRTVLLSSPDVRPNLRRLCEGPYPEVAVLTYSELEPNLEIRPLGRISAAQA